MSRSRRHAPCIGWTTARSEKRDTVAAHRRERRRVHAVLHADSVRDAPDAVLPPTRELSHVWDSAKNGRQYLGQRPRPELLRSLRK